MKTIKCITALLTLLILIPANSQYINPIVDYSKEGVYSNLAILTDTHLVYQAKKEEISSLWSMNLNSKVKQKLFTGSISSLKKQNNQVYFTVQFESNKYRLWSSDGTKENTQMLSETLIGRNGILYSNQGRILAQNQQLQLLQVQSNQIINFGLKPLTPNSICVFDDNNLVILSESAEPKSYILSRTVGMVVNDFYQFNSEDDITLPQFVHSGDSCFLSYRDQEELQTLIISKDGNVSSFVQPNDIPKISFFFSHLDRLYVAAGEENVFNSIYRLTPDLTTYDKSASLNPGFIYEGAVTRNDFIVTRVRENYFEGRLFKVILNADLDFIPTYYNSSQVTTDLAYELPSDVLTGFYNPNDGVVLQFISSNEEVNLMRIQDYYYKGITSNPNSDEFYLILTSQKSGRTDIFSYSDRPKINNSIIGTWHEHDIYSQGLVIQKGQRNNGSDYLFTTFYTFDMGEPLWLAGNEELLPEQNQIEVALYKYDGIQLFEYNNTPNSELFGQLKIQIETCNRIKTEFISDAYDVSINLYRIDDKSYDYLCNKFTPLPFDNMPANNLIMEQNK